MAVATIRELLDAGVHFGHESRRWNPRMKKYIFEERSGVHIIDLTQTLDQLEGACEFVRETVIKGRPVLFVGTKRQAKDPIREAATKAGMFHVTERWLGGLLTNNRTIRKSVTRLKEIEKLSTDGIMEKLPKKEVSSLRHEKAKLDRNLVGITEMAELPGGVFIVDPKKEHIAVAEARRLRIPIVALVDTNCDPTVIDYPIASNDDAIRAITLVAELVSRACIEGMKLRPVPEAEKKRPRPRRGEEAGRPEGEKPEPPPEAAPVAQVEPEPAVEPELELAVEQAPEVPVVEPSAESATDGEAPRL